MRANAYQAAVLDFVRRSGGHGVVEATAGSGKTTTLVMVAGTLVAELGTPPGDVAFLAFNRSAAAELRRRLPAGVEALTLHALGRRVLLAAGHGADVAEDKYLRLAADLPAAPHTRPALAELARFARLELSALAEGREAAALAERYGVELPGPPDAVTAALARLLELGASSALLDFTDLLYLPVRLALPVPRFAVVCVDEAQDLSRLALAFVERLVAAGARALFVGDPHQAIYAFAGADARSLPRIERLTRAERLPLSVSFRCPTRHVALARRFSPEMLPAPGAVPGTVRFSDVARLPREAAPGDLVLARTNGPLLDLALAVASAGRPVAVLGDELLPGCVELAERLARDGQLERAAVAAALEAERQRLEAEHVTSLALPGLLDAVRQRHAAVALALIAARSGLLPDVLAALRRLFPAGDTVLDGPGRVLLATVHKAKGREAERVFLLAPEELGVGTYHGGPPREGHADAADTDAAASDADPLTRSRGADDDAAEANVLFVALTRAKRELVLVERTPGAVAARLRSRSAGGSPAWLTRRWDDVLRLAVLMSGAAPETGISSRHGEARGVQDAGREARGRRRGRGGREDRLGRGDRRLLPRARDGPGEHDRGPRGGAG